MSAQSPMMTITSGFFSTAKRAIQSICSRCSGGNPGLICASGTMRCLLPRGLGIVLLYRQEPARKRAVLSQQREDAGPKPLDVLLRKAEVHLVIDRVDGFVEGGVPGVLETVRPLHLYLL